ncbi:hypothetical protein BW723_04750 [Polaribacter reichenbachii]|uniref:DUF4132 domain-containing protein n=3 Tax=Polaribacter reichenbachii TaxID=996801 RepID=A0A1B8TU78_9FLAO|nr:DUF6493 family protein [Polaribacter reichenbachii]APZ45648.1 hypothetical protein BW723_04750 [Polaribacter reichenbachii]OBY63336.1 hypothetical protein LPB301_10960 [Polaribacter reichenbachii]
MIDELKKELQQIIHQEKEKEIIPFLKKITFKEKKALVPFLKKYKEQIFETYTVEEKSKWGLSFSRKDKHSIEKRDLITKVCFVCYNKTDFKKAFWNSVNIITSDEYINDIIPWYVPNWYSNLINEENSWSLDYLKTMFLMSKGLLEPSNNLIVSKLPNAIIDSKTINGINVNSYTPEVLESYSVTLNEHIWLIFEEDSSINNNYINYRLNNYNKKNDVWIDTFIDLVEAKKLDRNKVLEASILTSTKNFNQNLTGWFFDLFIKLAPTNDEVLALQNELFSALNSPHSKVVNTVLRFFKKVGNLKKFQQLNFIENCSILLNSETKSVVNSTLILLDKIAKSNNKLVEDICLKTTEALLNVDDKIQLRASKIISKYGNIDSVELKDEVNLYQESLFYSSKKVLSVFIEGSEEDELAIEEELSTQILTESNRVEVYSTFDELLFFVSQVLDNNGVHHIDLFLSYAPRLNLLINSENVSKLEPIFKRALDLTFSFENRNSQIGELEFKAAYYLNDFSEILMEKYANELQNFKNYKTNKIQKLKKENFFRHYKGNLKEIEYQSINNRVYHIHQSLFIASKKLIQAKMALEFLSTPTHYPCWVAPEILIDRIKKYENSTIKINPYDIQIAIARLPLNEFDDSLLHKINEIRNKEIQETLKYFYNFLPLKEANVLRKDVWMQAVLCKKNSDDINYFKETFEYKLEKETTDYKWDCKLQDHIYNVYDYEKRKNVYKTIQKKEIRFFTTKEKIKETFIQQIKSYLNPKKENSIVSMYSYIRFNKRQYETVITPKDDVKFLNLAPNNPEVFLQQVVKYVLSESTFTSETNKKNMVNILKGLFDIWCRKDYQESVYLFLAASFLCSDKVSRELAAEIWIKAVSENNFKTELFGRVLGKLQYNEYGSFKRFTDLLTLNLLNISKNHNRNLLVLLNAMIANMNEKPLRNTKKLVDILFELKQAFKDFELSDKTKDKLTLWSKTKSLSLVIKKII